MCIRDSTIGDDTAMNTAVEMIDKLRDTTQSHDPVSYTHLDVYKRQIPAGALEMGHRTSLFAKKPWCIVSARFALTPGNEEEVRAKMDDFTARRAEKQPLNMPSAGSMFKRPPGAFAGALIDECGLRGFSVGGAAISEKHCGFVVNKGGATCADVLAVYKRQAPTCAPAVPKRLFPGRRR